MKIRCLIVDDEPLAVDLLEDFISRVPSLVLAAKCFDALEALRIIEAEVVDVVFLDINMPHLTGLEFATLLPARTRIIFTTAYTDFAIESYERNAVDYLLKPITMERFLRAVNKVKEVYANTDALVAHAAEKSSVLFVKSGKKILRIDLQEVTHIEGKGDYALFHHGEEKVMVGKTLKELESSLPAYIQRIHLSFFVNLDQIRKIEDNHVSVGKVTLPISSKYRDSFLSQVNQRLL